MKNLSVYLIFTLLISVLTASCGAARNSTVLRHEDNYWLSFKVIHQKIASVPLSKNTFHVKPAEADRLRTTFKRVLSKNEAAGLSIPTVRNLFIQLNQERSTNLKLIFDNSLESPIYLRFSRQLRPESLNKARPKRRFILIIETFSTEKSLPTWTLNMLESLALEGIPGTFFATLIGITAASTVCLSTLYSIARKSSVPFRDLYKKKLLKYPEILSQIGKQTAFYEKVETTNSFIQDLVVKSRLIQASPISWLTSSTLAPFAPNIAFACLGAPFTETILELLRSPVFETIPQKLVLVAPASAISDAYLATILRLKNKTAKDIQLIVLDLHDEHYVDMRDADALEQLRQLKGPAHMLKWRFAQISKTAVWTVSSQTPRETKKFILQDSANKPFEVAQAITNEYQELTTGKLSELVREYQLPPATNLLVFDETSKSLSITRPDEPISFGVFFVEDFRSFDISKKTTQITLSGEVFNGEVFELANNFKFLKSKSNSPLEISDPSDQKFVTTFVLTMITATKRIERQTRTDKEQAEMINELTKKTTARQQSLKQSFLRRVSQPFFDKIKQKKMLRPTRPRGGSPEGEEHSTSFAGAGVSSESTRKIARLIEIDIPSITLALNNLPAFKNDTEHRADKMERIQSWLRILNGNIEEKLSHIPAHQASGEKPLIIIDHLECDENLDENTIECEGLFNKHDMMRKLYFSFRSHQNINYDKALITKEAFDSLNIISAREICIDPLLKKPEISSLNEYTRDNPRAQIYYIKLRINNATAATPEPPEGHAPTSTKSDIKTTVERPDHSDLTHTEISTIPAQINAHFIKIEAVSGYVEENVYDALLKIEDEIDKRKGAIIIFDFYNIPCWYMEKLEECRDTLPKVMQQVFFFLGRRSEGALIPGSKPPRRCVFFDKPDHQPGHIFCAENLKCDSITTLAARGISITKEEFDQMKITPPKPIARRSRSNGFIEVHGSGHETICLDSLLKTRPNIKGFINTYRNFSEGYHNMPIYYLKTFIKPECNPTPAA